MIKLLLEKPTTDSYTPSITDVISDFTKDRRLCKTGLPILGVHQILWTSNGNRNTPVVGLTTCRPPVLETRHLLYGVKFEVLI